MEEAVTRAVQVKAMHTLEGEDQGVGSRSVVEAVEVGGAEEDKGIEEGEAGGFVVVARDSKVRGIVAAVAADREAAKCIEAVSIGKTMRLLAVRWRGRPNLRN